MYNSHISEVRNPGYIQNYESVPHSICRTFPSIGREVLVQNELEAILCTMC